MTYEEAQVAHVKKAVVVYRENEYYIHHFEVYFDAKDGVWVEDAFLANVDGINSSVVARLSECSLKR